MTDREELPPDYVPNRNGIPGTCEIVSDDDDDDTWVTDDSETDDDDSSDSDYEESVTSPRRRGRFLGMYMTLAFTPYQLVYTFAAVMTGYVMNAVIWSLY